MRMSGASAFGASLVFLVASSGAAALAADGVPLAKVAHDLGFRYAYLDQENGVSLTRAGAVIVIRPGDGYFTVNNRHLPVYGVIPFYRDNDVVVSRALEREIANFLPTKPHVAARTWPAAAKPALAERVAPPVEAGQVRSVEGTFTPAASSVEIVGRATPGTTVTLELRAALSDMLPVVTLDGTAVVADRNGDFEAQLDNSPDRFSYSRLFVVASAPGNVTPITVFVLTNRVDQGAHTSADDALKQ
jgi:hypothetical protein